ncbi:hypothetical protein [Bacillus cereus]
MTQNMTIKVKMLPTKEQSSQEYIKLINTLISEMVEEKKNTKKSTKDIKANLPSAVKNQAIKDAKVSFL